ncbi:DUF6519 domain-containing protein [Paraburkholderia dipogonis]|uniref:DUF6519 domain-containing protein n=1 Tax=Paraburkholderia dipogonis TaxID=1211383 RepID=UPI0038BDBC2B
MKADLTRSTDRPDQHYRAVRMQQGRVQLDAEWNEQQDILNRRIETETHDTLGEGAAAPITGGGFLLTGAGDNVTIGSGRCYVQGLLCEAGAELTVIAQPGVPFNVSPVVPEGQSLLALPPANAAALTAIKVYDGKGVAVAPADGSYIGYVEAWLRHVTALEDALIREVALGVPDTTTRDQLVWQVKVLRAGDLATPLTCLTDEPWLGFTAAPDGTFAARAEPAVPPKDPCLLTPEAGYRRLENQLYRVEIHDDGSVSGDVRYKWSRDNGSIVTRVTRWLGEPTADEFEVASIGRDATLAITADCWVEFFDDTHDLLGQPGVLVQVLKTAGNVVTVDLATRTGALDKARFGANPRVRRWENWAQMAPAASATAGGWDKLEDGIEIKFTPGRYRIGDYWTVPARTATADIEWPQDDADKPRFLAPQGIMRAFARLAVLKCQGGVWTTISDCRRLFPASSELTNLYYVGGDGQRVMPDLIAPVAAALPQPLEVAVFNGQFPVAGAQVRFTASDGALPNMTLEQIVNTGADGVAAIHWSIAPTATSQTCVAQLLEAGSPAAGKFNRIDFSAGTLTAAQVAYDPAKCADASAAGIGNVQEALDALCQMEHAGGGGCCRTVGENGDFPTLDVALRKLLQKESDICLCLLPGEHHFSDELVLNAPPGVHLHVHGAGQASRLIVDKQEFDLFDFASVTFEDFEIQWTRSWAVLRMEGCAAVRFTHMGLSGFTSKGGGLLKIGDAMTLEITGCRISGYAGETLPDHQTQLFTRMPSLKLMEAAFTVDDGRVFAPIDPEIAKTVASLGDGPRKRMSEQIATVLRAGETGEFPLGAEETAGLMQLAADLQSKTLARGMLGTLDQWRTGVLLSHGGEAVTLLDARAQTLIADNVLNGSLSLYGEFTEMRLPNLDTLHSLSERIKKGDVTLSAGRGRLHLRSNVLRGVRLGDERVTQLLERLHGDGAITDCYRSLVADANVFTADTADLLAIDAALTNNSFETSGDVGNVIASKGKYMGNFATDGLRLIAIGHAPDQFGNAPLYIMAV